MGWKGSLIVVALLLVAAGCTAVPPAGNATAGLAIADPWVRAAATGNSAAYMLIRNGGTDADRLVKAEADVAAAVELHETKMEGNMMKMAPVEGIAIPAAGQVELKPGGLHIMLIGLKRELKAGESVKLTLHFAKAGVREITAQVR